MLAALVGAAAGLSRPDPVCERPADAARALSLDRPADLAHLRDDVMRARTAAEAFAAAVAKRPLMSDSVDALEGKRTAPARALAWCEATLAAEIAAQHTLSPGTVQEQFSRLNGTDPGPSAGGPQAEADRASGTTAVSPVVSRPSR
jgi:hypothetical protein